MYDRDMNDMYFNDNEHNNQHPFQYETYQHIDQDTTPPEVTSATPPQLGARIHNHACRNECQSGQNIGEGNDDDGVTHSPNNPDAWLESTIEDNDSIQGDEGLSPDQLEFPNPGNHWMAIYGHLTTCTEIFTALAEHLHCPCHHQQHQQYQIEILPSPDLFTSVLNSPMYPHSGFGSPSPTESMIVETGVSSGSGGSAGRQSLMSSSSSASSLRFHRVVSTPSLVSYAGAAFESAFPPLVNFHAGPLWMGEEPVLRRGRRVRECFSPLEIEVEGDL